MAETGRILMVYYSFEGNVEYISRIVSKELPADLFRLEPDREPPKKGIGKILLGGMDVVLGRLPRIVPCKYNLSDYSQIIIATPVWAGSYAPALGTFLKENHLQGKRIYLIVSSSSGNADKMLLKLEDSLTGNNVVGTLSVKDPLRNEEEERPRIEAFLRGIQI
ncbi:flavodoxin family protein [Butyrivibrio sp. MC2013]|uniref:flavodoxin family protein n=1 Tax=Butyrivibrio sp. MC2013 TaxID=1280686 RepID=UPI0003FB04AD|nr:hypothetical protein [Butyrivibrio sp. MC2013]